MTSSLTSELASAAARLIVEEGMEYGPAKRRAARMLGKHNVRPAELPDNEMVENEVRAYLDLFCADTHPHELKALRRVAEQWMERLQAFRPYLTGAVWRGTATRLSSVHLQLFCDDPKSAELALIDQHINYDTQSVPHGPRGEPMNVLTVSSHSDELAEPVTVHLSILDHDDLRGALKPNASGHSERGDLTALRRLMESSS